MANSSQSSSSTSAFVSTLIFNGIIALVFVLIFLRIRPFEKRVYQPRLEDPEVDIRTIKKYEKVDEPIPEGFFKWIPFLLSKPHSFLIQHCSVDGYFYLRYVTVFGLVSLMGCLILLPILLPVNATNGLKLKGFDILSFSNVKNNKRYYAHVFLSWLYFGGVIFVIYRELYYYIVTRHAVETSVMNTTRNIGCRTVLLSDCDLTRIDSDTVYRKFVKVEKVTMAKDYTDLEKNCHKRDKYAQKLEKLLNKLIKKSVGAKIKWEKKDRFPANLNGKSESDFQSYLGKRPHHRLKNQWWTRLIPFYGKSVDSIDYYLKEINVLNSSIATQQSTADSSFDTIGGLFVTFKTQYHAQLCFQSIDYVFTEKTITNLSKSATISNSTHFKDLPFNKKYIGYEPSDLVWSNLSMSSKTRHGKKTLATFMLTMMIIFWSIPVAVIGCISNINYLISIVPFLSFINNCPKVILGLITGLLPVVLLSLLMSLVPPVIKVVGKFSGLLTLQDIDLFCQKWFFAFQVIDVFIVVTAASSASSTVNAIINDPSSAMTLLATNLPKASNFYINYFLLQGLTVPSGILLQAITLVLFKFLSKALDSTPREKWTRYNTLVKPSWGVMYPIMELYVVLYLAYALISPILLLFSTICFMFMFLAYMYNLNYVSGFSGYQLKGRNYVRAVFQVFSALYIAEVCLFGLFLMSKNWGCMVLEIAMLVFTVLAHLVFQRIFLPLVDIVPLSIINNPSMYEKYPSDEGYQSLKTLHEKLNEENIHEQEEIGNTSQTVRSATTQELIKAHYLPESNDEASANAANEQEVHQKHAHTQSAGGSTFVNEEHAFTSYTDENSGTTTQPTQHNDTETVRNEEFHKLHYADVKNLPSGPPQESPQHFEEMNLHEYPSNIPCTGGFSKYGIKNAIMNVFHPSRMYTFEQVKKRMPRIYEVEPERETAMEKKHKTSSQGGDGEEDDTEEPNNDSSSLDDVNNNNVYQNPYTYPRLQDKEPVIWVARDPMGISESQITYARNFNVTVQDRGAIYDERGKSMYTDDPPNYDINAM